MKAPPAEGRALDLAAPISVLIHVTDPAMEVDKVVAAYDRVLAGCPGPTELVFILDGVGGEVFRRLERLEAARSDVRILTLQGGGNGESIAFTAARDHARGAVLVTAPDYLQIDPSVVPEMLKRLTEGMDLVCGWRRPRVDPWLNRVQSRFFNWFLRRLSGAALHDLNCTFRAIRREVLEEVPVYGDQFRFLPILAERRGFKVGEIPVRHLEERGKTGFFGIGVYLRRLLDILAVTFLTRFTSKPLRFFGVLGLVLILVGLVFAVPPVYHKLFLGESIQDRPIFLMGVVLITFGLQLIGFGLVGEVVIFTQAKHLRDYKVDRIVTRDPAAVSPVPAAEDEESPKIVVPGRADRDERTRVRHAAPGEDAALDRFTEEHSLGTPFHLGAWRRMVEEIGGRPLEVLVAEKGGRVTGFLPFGIQRSWFLGRVAVSVPFAVYGGCLCADEESARALIERAIELVEAAGCRYLELRHQEPVAGGLGLVGSDRYVTFVRDLPADPEACLDLLPRKARAEARKGRDESRLSFREGLDLERFHRLFAQNKKRLGSPPVPLPMLESLARQMGARMVLHRVEDPRGRTVAGVLSFLFRDRIYPYYSGTESSFPRGTNNFMYWRLMCWAVEHGFRSFDFGRSRRDSGAASFKRNMGFEAKPLHYEYHLGPGAELPDFHPDNPRLGIYRQVWRRLPEVVVRRFGGRLFRQLP